MKRVLVGYDQILSPCGRLGLFLKISYTWRNVRFCLAYPQPADSLMLLVCILGVVPLGLGGSLLKRPLASGGPRGSQRSPFGLCLRPRRSNELSVALSSPSRGESQASTQKTACRSLKSRRKQHHHTKMQGPNTQSACWEPQTP